MKVSAFKILMGILILVVIPGACLVMAIRDANDAISFNQLSFSDVAESMMVYYLLMAVVVAAFYIIRKIIAYSNREK